MIWGKIIGALAGYALGHSPLGALAGAAIGHWVDIRLARRFPNADMVRRRDVF